MKAGIELFLHSSEYRKIFFGTIVRRIQRTVFWPITYIKARLYARKFLKEHPDNWDRYLEMKKIEEQIEENDRLYKITELRMLIRHNLTLMQIKMLTYIAKIDPLVDDPKAKEEPVEKIKKEFHDYKQNALEGIEECKKLGGVMPDALSEIIRGCTFDSCESINELKEFSNRLCEQLEEFDFGESTG